MSKDKITSPEDLRLKPKANKRVVLTNGCFDILHIGHTRYLEQARSLGDLLVVAINSDDSVKKLKGEKRPILPWAERAEVVAALGCVDYVVPIVDLTACHVLKTIKPAIYLKGGECKDFENTEEVKTARSIRAVVCKVPSDVDRSTSDIVQRILLTYTNGG